MIPREILQQTLADYEKAVEEIQGMEDAEVVEYLWESGMRYGLCYYLDVKFDVSRADSANAFGDEYLGGCTVLDYFPTVPILVPALTARLQLRINKLKELLNDNPLPLPK